MKDPKEVKILALRGAKHKKILPSDDRVGDSGTRPGRNSPEEVRTAQRNLVACGLDAELIKVTGQDALDYHVTEIDQVMKDVLEMITPNSAYVTSPVSWRQIKGPGPAFKEDWQ